MNPWKPIATVPRDNTPVLVLLREPFMDMRVHSAIYHGTTGIVGGYFSFDVPEATHWTEPPEIPEGV
jgi:hypothetical protein